MRSPTRSLRPVFGGAPAMLAIILSILLVGYGMANNTPAPKTTPAKQDAVTVKPTADAESRPAKEPVATTPSTEEPHSFIATNDLKQIVADAGWPMYGILFCSFLLVTFTLERVTSLRRSRVIPKPFVTRFLQQLSDGQLDREQALQLCAENASPVANVFAGALRKWGRPGVEVEQGVIDAGERATNELRRYLRVFYGVATVGPLLGLMGTVLGMIQTFNVIAAADALGRAELLAGGIAKALLNTAGGLAVAIPASILYTLFVSRVDRLVMDIDKVAQQVVNLISAEELQERKIAAPKSRRANTAVA